ncbi:MAG: hypothetical protein JW700_01280 [Candidatus Aenigmarchaeota archaeon]|nr:hypothetical protein [Candidatus Aenigmarchaeota archaeon]
MSEVYWEDGKKDIIQARWAFIEYKTQEEAFQAVKNALEELGHKNLPVGFEKEDDFYFNRLMYKKKVPKEKGLIRKNEEIVEEKSYDKTIKLVESGNKIFLKLDLHDQNRYGVICDSNIENMEIKKILEEKKKTKS